MHVSTVRVYCVSVAKPKPKPISVTTQTQLARQSAICLLKTITCI